MKMSIRKTFIAAFAALIAGAGIASAEVAHGTSPDVPETSAESVAAPTILPRRLARFAQNGGHTMVIQGARFNNNKLVRERETTGVIRHARFGTVQGQTVRVVFDRIPGSRLGLLQHRFAPRPFGLMFREPVNFRVTGRQNAVNRLPSGIYNGFLDVSVTRAGNRWQFAIGEANIILRSNGQVLIGGISSSGRTVIEIFGESRVRNGRFQADLTINLRDGDGRFIRRETGVMRGFLGRGTDTSVILGTLRGNNRRRGFAFRGGFNAIHAPEWGPQ